MKEFLLEVLGVPYTIRIGTQEELGIDPDLGGDSDFYTKVIRIRTDLALDDGESRKGLLEATYRHEVCHVFLYECGLISFAMNEVVVEWLEVNLPKLFNLIQGTLPQFFSAVEAFDKGVGT